jgi:hypothetical protein
MNSIHPPALLDKLAKEFDKEMVRCGRPVKVERANPAQMQDVIRFCNSPGATLDEKRAFVEQVFRLPKILSERGNFSRRRPK